MAILRRRIRDQRVVALCEAILASGAGILEGEYELAWFAGDGLFTPLERRRGLPIGNLTSQFFGNVYLNELDHFIKERLRVRCYLRYMDDIAVFGADRRCLSVVRQRIEHHLESLRLTLHRQRTRVWRSGDGSQFLGLRIFPGHRLIRKATACRYCRHLKGLVRLQRTGHTDLDKLRESLVAWFGHTRHASCYQLNSTLLRRAGLLAP